MSTEWIRDMLMRAVGDMDNHKIKDAILELITLTENCTSQVEALSKELANQKVKTVEAFCTGLCLKCHMIINAMSPICIECQMNARKKTEGMGLGW